EDTVFQAGKTLNYAVPIDALTLPPNTELPAQAVMAENVDLPVNTVLSAAVRDADGKVVYAAGTLLKEKLTLSEGWHLDAGTRLPRDIPLSAMTWPAGVPLPVAATLAADTPVPVGGLIPS